MLYTIYLVRPQYNRECTELYFFENYHISNNRQPTTNYESIHFIMGGKELTEEEIKKYTLEDPKNKIINLYKDNRDLLKIHYHVRVVLKKPTFFISAALRTRRLRDLHLHKVQ
jgi:hypothetical protein